MIEKYTFDLQAPKIEKKKLILVKSENETHGHVVLKVLAYLLYYDPRLKIECQIGMHYKPDLAVEGGNGVPELWIDCGHVAIKKVESLAQKLRTTHIVFLKETQRELDQFRNLVSKKVDQSERLHYLAFEPGFIDGISHALQRINTVTLYNVMENVIGLAVNDQVFESTLYR